MYPLSGDGFANLYQFWARAIADTLPAEGLLVNAASEEYFKLIRPHVDPVRLVEPYFLSQMSAGRSRRFRSARQDCRGAFAGWLILNRVTDPDEFRGFDDLDYAYDPATSTRQRPVFIKRVPG